MKLTIQIQLLPNADQSQMLRDSMEQINAAANWISAKCFDKKESNQIEVRKFAYREIREKFRLSSQMAQAVIKNVCDCYKRDKSKIVHFRRHSSVAHDERSMSYKENDCISILTLEGRVVVPFVAGEYHKNRFSLAKGQARMVLRGDGKWFLFISVEVAEQEKIKAKNFLGVDLGIINIATDSDGVQYGGSPVEKIRKKHNLQKRRLQKKRTKGAKKKLKRLSGKESRFRRHENHVISRRIIDIAKRTGRGIALENLKSIHERVTARGGDSRDRLRKWAFYQLQTFIGYKARLAGVPVVAVNPAYTSQTCSQCGHCEKANRKNQAEFVCKACGIQENADVNAARNIRALGIRNVPTELAGFSPSRKPAKP